MHISTAKSRVVWIEKQRFSYNPCGVWLRAAHDPFRRHTNHHHGARRTSALRASPFAAMSCAASVCARSARLSTVLSTGVHRGAIIRGGSPQSPAGLIFARCREVLKLADSCTACPQVSDRPGRRRRRRDHSGLSGRPRFACDRRRTRTRVDASRNLRHAKRQHEDRRSFVQIQAWRLALVCGWPQRPLPSPSMDHGRCSIVRGRVLFWCPPRIAADIQCPCVVDFPEATESANIFRRRPELAMKSSGFPNRGSSRKTYSTQAETRAAPYST